MRGGCGRELFVGAVEGYSGLVQWEGRNSWELLDGSMRQSSGRKLYVGAFGGGSWREERDKAVGGYSGRQLWEAAECGL